MIEEIPMTNEERQLYTIENLKGLVRGPRINIRNCSICDTPIGYIVDGGENVYFDSNCNCVNYWTKPTESSWADMLQTVTMQRTPEIRAKMWEKLVA